MKESTKRVTVYLSSAASVFTLIIAWHWLSGSAEPDVKFGMSLLSLFALFFLVFSIIQEYRYSHKSRYLQALPYINKIYQLYYTVSEASITNIETITLTMEKICDNMSHAFNLITNTHCAACIKMLSDIPGKTGRDFEITVKTVCRDSLSNWRQTKHSDIEHRIDRNTDFYEIFRNFTKPNGRAFFCNNLPARHDYRNTSFDVYGRGEPKEVPVICIRNLARNIQWSLPYRSTIVAAIYPLKPSDDDLLAGFLCIDSKSRNVFWERYDVDLMINLAAAIYPIVIKLQNIVLQQTKGAEHAE